MHIGFMHDDFFTEYFCRKYYGKCYISTLAKYGINVIGSKIPKRLNKTEGEEKGIFQILEKCFDRFLSTEFSGEDRLEDDTPLRKGG